MSKIKEVQKMYIDGKTGYHISKVLDIPKASVYYWIKTGFKECPQYKYSEEDIKSLQAEYDSGLSVSDLREKYGITDTTIKNWENRGKFHKRILSEAVKLARIRGKCKLTEKGRAQLQQNGVNAAKNRKSGTLPERIFEAYLIKRGIEHETQFPIDNYVVDFAIPELKKAYEVYGDYWHSNPIKYPEPITKVQKFNKIRDKLKIDYLRSKGWEVNIIWEYDLKNNRGFIP